MRENKCRLGKEKRKVKTYLGLDIGTTSLKAAAFDEKGNRLGLCHYEYDLNTDAKTGYIECDPELYVTLCRKAIAELTSAVGKIDAISVDTQGETMIVTDEAGCPLYPAIVWLDNRATAEAEAVKAQFGNRLVYEVTGQPEITAGWPACKLLWFKNHLPDVFARIRKVFLLEDWILYRLTGEFVTEPTIQSSSVYFDIRTRAWWREMLDFIGVGEEIFPRVCKSAEKIGEADGIPVVSGALDQIAGTIGTGAVEEGIISEMTGTIMAICAMTDEIPPYDPASIIPCHLHAAEGKYCRLLWSGTAGMALKWFKNNFSENFSFGDLDALAEKVPAGCDGMTMLPHFTGATMPKYNPEARAAFAGVTLSHTRAHFARSIMEAIAFQLRQDLEYIGAGDVREIRITGGGATGTLWPQIKADVTGKLLRKVKESETACLGCAILAAVGIGDAASIREAAFRMTETAEAFSSSGVDYGEAFARFCELENKLI